MQGKSPVVTAKSLQNFYIEFRPQGEKTQVVAHGFPGLDLFADFGDTAIRGAPLAVEQNDLAYLVHRGTFWQINNAAAKTSRGTLNTQSGWVDMVHNGTYLMAVDGTNGYTYHTGTTAFAQISDVDFPASPTSCTWLNGFFVVGFDTGRFYVATDPTSWDALDFATAESNPDKLVRVMADHGELVLFGDISTEFWGVTGAVDFPFGKIQGADAEWGLAARASVAKFDDSLAFLCKNRMGEVIVGKLRGHQVEKISTPDLDYLINEYAVTSDATGHSWLDGGHPFYQLNFPSAGASWCFDGLTSKWSKRKSESQTRHRAEYGAQYLSRTLLTDASTGRLYKLNKNTFTENGSIIEGEIVGEHWDNELNRDSIDTVRLDIETGVGTTSGQGSNPQVMLQVSKDGGKSWGVERWRSLGALGDYLKRVEWHRFGDSRRWTMKVRITDPVKRTVLGAYVNPE